MVLGSLIFQAGPEEVEAAKAIVKKMSTDYHPEAISNPSLQRYYAELEALALERADPRADVDHTRTSPSHSIASCQT